MRLLSRVLNNIVTIVVTLVINIAVGEFCYNPSISTVYEAKPNEFILVEMQLIRIFCVVECLLKLLNEQMNLVHEKNELLIIHEFVNTVLLNKYFIGIQWVVMDEADASICFYFDH